MAAVVTSVEIEDDEPHSPEGSSVPVRPVVTATANHYGEGRVFELEGCPNRVSNTLLLLAQPCSSLGK